MKKPYSIQELLLRREEDLSLCRTVHEQIMCRSVCNKEILDRAKEIRKTRRLTARELRICQTINPNFEG
jgi:hypothetical protein